jgi:hypothetical protein
VEVARPEPDGVEEVIVETGLYHALPTPRS